MITVLPSLGMKRNNPVREYLSGQRLMLYMWLTGQVHRNPLLHSQPTSLLFIQPYRILIEQKITFYLTLLMHWQIGLLLEKSSTGDQVLEVTE
jgi:hypothetical protein